MIKILLIYALYTYIMAFVNKKKNIAYCGLIGYSGSKPVNLDKLQLIMFWNSITRNSRDATGIYTPLTGIIKDNDPAEKFFLSKEMAKFKEDNTVVAHVRAKTIGVNSARNAHPFKYGNTILAHNGTLTNTISAGVKYGIKATDWDVDSQMIAQAINQEFEKKEETLKFNILGDYQGAAALLFYNEDTECLYAYHDSQRPLFYGFDIDGCMYISSLKEPLEVSGIYAIEEFDKETLYTIKEGVIINTEKYDLYDVVHKEEIEAAKEAAKAKDKAKRRGKDLKFPKLKEGQRGFAGLSADVEPYYFVGYWLKSSSNQFGTWQNCYGNGAKLIKDKWYQCVGYFPSEHNRITALQIDAENGIAITYPTSFNTTSFIPRKGDYVIFMKDCISEKGELPLWKKGDVVEVLDTDFERPCVSLYHEESNINFNVPNHFVRLAEEHEITEDDGNESPFVEEISDSEENIQTLLRGFREHEQQEEEISASEEYIDKAILEGFIDRINEHMILLEEKYLSNQDITSDINEINAILNGATDQSFMEAIKTKV